MTATDNLAAAGTCLLDTEALVESTVRINGHSLTIRYDLTVEDDGAPCVGWINGVIADAPGERRSYDVGGGWLQADGSILAYEGYENGGDVGALAAACGLVTEEDDGEDALHIVWAALAEVCPDTWPGPSDDATLSSHEGEWVSERIVQSDAGTRYYVRDSYGRHGATPSGRDQYGRETFGVLEVRELESDEAGALLREWQDA